MYNNFVREKIHTVVRLKTSVTLRGPGFPPSREWHHAYRSLRVIPAKAGIQVNTGNMSWKQDLRLYSRKTFAHNTLWKHVLLHPGDFSIMSRPPNVHEASRETPTYQRFLASPRRTGRRVFPGTALRPPSSWTYQQLLPLIHHDLPNRASPSRWNIL
jgi:hypothetical protein